jgi:hypothetical protein
MKNTVMTCILLHNMMVEHRISNDEHEHINLYQTIHDVMPPAAVAAAAVPNLDLPTARDEIIYYGSGNHQRWKHLVDKAEHVVLHNAICRELICKQQQQHPPP